MKKRLLGTFLAVAMALVLLPQNAHAEGFTRSRTYTAGQFIDVPDNAWYASTVKDCYELGLMNGNGDDTFNPSGMFTVAEAVAIAARLHSIYNGGNGIFPIEGGEWYRGAVNYALQNGIISSGQFQNYGQAITRAEMAGVMVRALPDNQWTAKNNVTALPDVTATTRCFDAIFTLYDAGVFVGSDEYGAFQPYAYITRAEVSAIVARCADPAQRQTLHLTPLSQMEPVVISNFKAPSQYIDPYGMSEGLLRVQNTTDSKGRLYGYMNYKGEVVIPYQFTSAGDFSNGYAIVRVPDYGASAVNTKGQLLIPRGYEEVVSNGHYLIASTQTSCTLYSFTGERLNSFDGSDYAYRTVDEIDHADNNPLLKIKHGKKWALATTSGEITEAVYDSVTLMKNSNFAILKIGTMETLAGPNGIIFNFGEYTYDGGTGNYAMVYSKEKGKAITDVTGNLSDFNFFWGGVGYPYVSDAAVIAYNSSYGEYILYDRLTGQTLTYSVHDEKGFSNSGKGDFYSGAGHLSLPDGGYMLLDGTRCLSVEQQDIGNARDGYRKYWVYQALNGKYGLAFDGVRYTSAIYNSPEDVWANYGYNKISTINGKPAVVYGNESKDFTPVIQFYKNGIPYDSI
ncbi:MAG: S-layer homology domain-containing protein, partial [Oscillospiraceae bacterium]|nr:S-layer homology domain-containing protein [Oscillospiraceae bacterium]